MRGVYSANVYIGSISTAGTLLILVVPANKVIEVITATMTNASNTSGEQLLTGLYTVSDLNSSFAISSVSITSNVATITTSQPHGFVSGEKVQVSAVTNTFFNGTFAVTGVTSTTFTYSLTHANVATTSDTGTVVSSPVVITNIAITSNVVTVTTATPYGWSVGGQVQVSVAINTFCNGAFVITGTPSSTTFTYSLTHANVASTSDTGTASFFPTAGLLPVSPLEGSVPSDVLAYGPVTAHEPTYSPTAVHQEGWSNQIGYRFQPFPEGRPVLPASAFLALRLLQSPSTSFNGVAEIIYKELG